VDDLVSQLIAGKFIEPVSGAVAEHQVIRIDLFEVRKNSPNVIVVERRNDMKSADHGMHPLHTGCELRRNYSPRVGWSRACCLGRG